MEKEDKKSKSVTGFFIAIGEEEISLLKKAKTLNTSRSGIFYKEDELISTILSKKALKESTMEIIKIQVEKDEVVEINDKKFGIKNGKSVIIKSIKPFATMEENVLETV